MTPDDEGRRMVSLGEIAELLGVSKSAATAIQSHIVERDISTPNRL